MESAQKETSAGVSLVFDDRAVYIEDGECLILSDLHLGREEGDSAQYTEMKERVFALIDRYAPEFVIFNGDIFNHFPFPEEGVQMVREISETVSTTGGQVQLLEGNHESSVGGFGNQFDSAIATGVEVELSLQSGQRVVVVHGHDAPASTGELIIIGHVHPITPDGRPCYGWGESAYEGTDVLILPAFSTLATGVDITTDSEYAKYCPLVGADFEGYVTLPPNSD